MNALMKGNVESVSDALSRGADPNTLMGTVTPLHWAVMFGPEECVKMLLKAGADVNARDAVMGRPPLHYASIAGEEARVVQALIDAGADVNAESPAGYTALDHAAGACNEAAAAALARAGGHCRADRREWVTRVIKDSAPEKGRGRD